MLRRLLLLVCLLGVPLLAQERVAAPPIAGPTLTADEAQARELLSLKAQLITALKQVADLQATVGACQGQLGTYQYQQNAQAFEQDRKTLQTRIEARTGYTWNPDTGTFGAKKPSDAPGKE